MSSPVPRLERTVSTGLSTVIGVASVAPLYSIVVTVGLIHELVGRWTAPVLVLAALPMLLVARCFAALDDRYEDQGTVYRWAREAFGRLTSFMGGWGLWLSGMLVLSCLADVVVAGTAALAGVDAGEHRAATVAAAAGLLTLSGWMAGRGRGPNGGLHRVLIGVQAAGLVAVVVVMLTHDAGPAAPLGPTALTPSPGALSSALLLALFLYWGWDSTFALTEESTTQSAPRVSAGLSLLLLIVACAAAWLLLSGPLFVESVEAISISIAFYYALACAAALVLVRRASVRVCAALGLLVMVAAGALSAAEFIAASPAWPLALGSLGLGLPLAMLLRRAERDPGPPRPHLRPGARP